MKKILYKYIEKLFYKKWIIGIYKGDIEDIIRKREFNPDIHWLSDMSTKSFQADPFILISDENSIKLLYEEFFNSENYGKIFLLVLDKQFKRIKNKLLLDSLSHISYPFIFKENNKTYVFPEAGRSGRLSCYEYDPVNESFVFLQDILDLSLFDSTIVKLDNKYWIFGSLSEIDLLKDRITDYKLQIFYSDNLLGPYLSHPSNPVISGLDGVRSAGNFIEVDGILYRPTQNCKKEYGESITIKKILTLTEKDYSEEPYYTISINKTNKCNYGMHTIHTINASGDLIVIDGQKWFFAPWYQFKYFLKNRLSTRNANVTAGSE